MASRDCRPFTIVVSTVRRRWKGGYEVEKRSLKYSNPRVWLEPTDHSTNCFFCMVDVSRRRKGKTVAGVDYPDLPSSIAPIPHCSKVQDKYSDDDEERDVEDLEYLHEVPEKVPHFPKQNEVNGLIRDMGLTMSNAELFISRMKQ
ncbi:uncharacterized protein LOC125032572 [Penaeus chinensis]|uniref:uncharacterized protein LOC125032572 n=1 Tax=Penaeus chinensis TaxID=139456 RepID=UPI001FB578A3|nr:uncharacterized protein LOC125032572 [Penaeus chinensis]